MKKILSITISVLLFTAFPNAAFAFFDHNLDYGSIGEDVTQLQEFLAVQGNYSGPITGKFYALTRQGVINFQRANDISPTAGYFGPITREKVNAILGAQDADLDTQVSKKTGITPAPTKNSDLIATLHQQIADLMAQLKELTATVQSQSAGTEKTDVAGVISGQIKEAPQSASSLTPTSSTGIISIGSLQITDINVTPALKSVEINWRTNKPSNSKMFISGGGLSSNVYASEAGISSYHVVHIPNLVSGTAYSYKIEAIADGENSMTDGSFATNDDAYTILTETNKTSVQATGWSGVQIKVEALKNGVPQKMQTVAMTATDSSQNQTRITNGQTSSNSGDWNTTFTFYPKTVGTHTLTFTWGGASKQVNINATDYIKEDSTISKGTVYQQDENNNSYPVQMPEYFAGYTNATVGIFTLSEGDEPFRLDQMTISSDIDTSKFRFFNNMDMYGASSGGIVSGPSGPAAGQYGIQIPVTSDVPVGTHTVTINTIRLIGIQSGDLRTVGGLPVTFTFKIK